MKTAKRIVSAILVVLICLTMAPLDGFLSLELPEFNLPEMNFSFITANAESTENGYIYKINGDGTATITGYSGNESALVIPSKIDGYTVVTIGNNAFYGNDRLTSVNIPDTVTEVGSFAFAYCINLSDLKLSHSLQKLGGQAFLSCNSLTAVEIPKSLTKTTENNHNYNGWSYKYGAFFMCENLKTVTFENGTTEIANGLFGYCTGLEKITIPDTVTVIKNSAFYHCFNLAEVKFSNSLTTIEDNAFLDCSSLTAVNMPDTVANVGNYAFAHCSKLADVKLSRSLQNLGGQAFLSCNSLTAIEIPKSLTKTTQNNQNYDGWSYKYGVFFMCENLKTVTFEKGATEIPNGLFGYCTGLEKITIPATVTVIENSAFYHCFNLAKVEFSDGLLTIEDNAFLDCPSLTAVNMPDTVTKVGNYAFAHCSKLSDVKLSRSLQNLGGQAFLSCNSLTAIEIPKSLTKTTQNNQNYDGWSYKYGVFFLCENLKTVTFEKGATEIPNGLFGYCTGLEKITIPDTVTVIENSAFYHCFNLAKVEFSDSLLTIEDNAFLDCPSLTAVNMPDTVTKVGNFAFAHCSKLADVKLSHSLQTLGGQAFLNCNSLTAIEIPKSLTKTTQNNHNYNGWGYKYGPFFTCENLKKVTFENGTTKIVNGLFAYCTGLETIELPETITAIDSNAFEFCTNLKKIYINDDVTSFGYLSFNGCSQAVLYCDYYSDATLFAIDNNLSFQTTGTAFPTGETALDRSKTRYFASVDAVSTNGYVNLTIDYNVTDSKITDKKLEITLPVGVELNEESLKLNGVLCTNYTVKDSRHFVVPVDTNEGTLKFNFKSKGDNDILSYALLTYKKDGSAVKEIIGIINENIKLIAMDLPDCISKNTVNISGVAPASATVKIYLDDEFVKEEKASKAGMWNTTVEISSLENLDTFIITAECTDENGDIMNASGEVTYRVGEPSLSNFTMGYNEHDIEKTVDLLADPSTLPVVYFMPGKEFSFELEFENPEGIKDLYITSTRNNITKYLEAEYNEETGTFVASGFFDENNRYYVPGVISYEYNRNVPDIKVGDNVDLTHFAAKLPEGAAESVEIKENTANDYKATIDLSSLAEGLDGVAIDTLISIYDAKTDGNLGEWMGFAEDAAEIVQYFLEGKDGKEYILNIDTSDPKEFIAVVRDVTGNKYVKFGLDTLMDNADDLGEYSNLLQISETLSAVNGIASYAYKYYSIEEDMDNLRDEIYKGNYSSDLDPATALKMVNQLESDQKLFELAMLALPLLVAGTAMTGPAIVFSAILGCFSVASSFAWEARKGQIKGDKFKLKMVIDPSGYVYDIATNDRLEGVTTTAYCIEYDESDGFWENKPADNVYGTKWDASEYNQQNPLITNADGKYAWDVPEGWWRVKYEKEGYETTWSEWMTVPPVQTEVNIGMKHTTHKWDKGKVTKAATCTKTGIKTFSCACGESYTEKISKDSKNHTNTKKVAAVAATIESVGYTAGVYCNDCKKYISGHTEIPKLVPQFTDSKQAKKSGNDILAINGLVASQLLSQAGKNAVIKTSDGKAVSGKDVICTGMTITLADGKVYTVVVYGDVDGNGTVTAADARLALRASVGLEKFSEASAQYKASNIESSDKVTAADARLILRGSVGLEDTKSWLK